VLSELGLIQQIIIFCTTLNCDLMLLQIMTLLHALSSYNINCDIEPLCKCSCHIQWFSTMTCDIRYCIATVQLIVVDLETLLEGDICAWNRRTRLEVVP